MCLLVLYPMMHMFPYVGTCIRYNTSKLVWFTTGMVNTDNVEHLTPHKLIATFTISQSGSMQMN